MKQVILSITILFTASIVSAQRTVSYEAANWKIWLLDKPQQITIAAPPANTPKELQQVKQQMANVDDKKSATIKYWNAGAPAYRWNQVVQKMAEQKPAVMLRMPAAWMNIAVYDATVLAWKEKLKYKRKHPAVDKPIVEAPATYSYPCEYSVTAAAAANVLAYFFPEKADSILQVAHMAAQSRVDAGVQFPSDVEAGWKLGEQVAKEIVEKAKNDGSATVWDGKMNKDPKKWTGNYPMGITMVSFKPIIINTADQFRPPAPPDFENDMKLLKDFKRTTNSNATAYYWATTSDAWGELAGKKMFEYRMQDDAPAVSRIYTVLTTSYHDAAIAIMDAKYAYWGIRPNQYDTTYKSLVPTPPFPGYPSGHAAGAATSAAILEYFFPNDAAEFRRMAQECADSRFYAGIHFRTDNETALVMGREMGKWMVENWMKK